MTEQIDLDLFSAEAKPFEDMNFEELAIDWGKRVADVSPVAMDSYVITDEGMMLTKQARREYNARFAGLPDPDAEEQARRDAEWRKISQSIFDADPGVIEKNRFLAALIDQNEIVLPHITNLLVGMRREAERGGNDQMTYMRQFLALWAIRKHGQESDPEFETS